MGIISPKTVVSISEKDDGESTLRKYLSCVELLSVRAIGRKNFKFDQLTAAYETGTIKGTTAALILLLMSMVNEKQPFSLRCAVLYCVQSFLFKVLMPPELKESIVVKKITALSSEHQCFVNIFVCRTPVDRQGLWTRCFPRESRQASDLSL